MLGQDWQSRSELLAGSAESNPLPVRRLCLSVLQFSSPPVDVSVDAMLAADYEKLTKGRIGTQVVDGKIDSLLPGFPALAAGLKQGDQVRTIDSIDTAGIDDKEIHILMRGYPKTVAHIEIERAAKKIDFGITRVYESNLENDPEMDLQKAMRLGQLALDQDNQVEAEAYFKKALDIARKLTNPAPTAIQICDYVADACWKQ